MHTTHVHDADSTLFGIIFAIPVMAVLGLWSLVHQARESKREAGRVQMVSEKYSGETASLIVQKMFWQGQTAEQLRDSLGPPEAVEVKLLKTKRREVWKYGGDGANRYRTRITLDNGIVSTWITR